MNYLCVAGFLFVVGGYIGKGLYVYWNESEGETFTYHDLANSAFWVPDGAWVLWGICFLALIFVVCALLRCLLIIAAKTCRCMCCSLCYHCFGLEEKRPAKNEYGILFSNPPHDEDDGL